MHTLYCIVILALVNDLFLLPKLCFNNTSTSVRSFSVLCPRHFYIHIQKVPFLSFSQRPHTTLICPCSCLTHNVTHHHHRHVSSRVTWLPMLRVTTVTASRFSIFHSAFLLTDHKNLQQDHCSSIANIMIMVTAVIEPSARMPFTSFSLAVMRLFSTSAFRATLLDHTVFCKLHVRFMNSSEKNYHWVTNTTKGRIIEIARVGYWDFWLHIPAALAMFAQLPTIFWRRLFSKTFVQNLEITTKQTIVVQCGLHSRICIKTINFY